MKRPEVRAKNAAAQKGKKHTLEAKAKMSTAQKGNKHFLGHTHPSETRAKISAAMMGPKNPNWGKHPSPETRARLSAAKKGSRHPHWRGGISYEPYTQEFGDELKEKIRRRDGYKCRLCGVPQAECERKLPVHHIDYDKQNSDPLNLVALCEQCHGRTNLRREHWMAHFQSLALKKAQTDPNKSLALSAARSTTRQIRSGQDFSA